MNMDYNNNKDNIIKEDYYLNDVCEPNDCDQVPNEIKENLEEMSAAITLIDNIVREIRESTDEEMKMADEFMTAISKMYLSLVVEHPDFSSKDRVIFFFENFVDSIFGMIKGDDDEQGGEA